MNRDASDVATLTMPLCGAGGEPVSLRATLASHGLAWLPPNDIAPDERTLTTTLRLADGRARTLTIRENVPGTLAIVVDGRRPSASHAREIGSAVRAMFALDDDLGPFYASLAGDADLAFAVAGYGRLLRSPTAFEDVVRTICTTNCSWSATERMIGALVTHLGTAAPLAVPGTWRGHAFPTAAGLAAAGEPFFRDTMRAGYRGAYLGAFAAAVAAGDLDVEAWRLAPRSALSDADLEQLLLALPGVGPYAAAHAMMLFGRCSRLVLDSWTRPRYAQLLGKKSVSDEAIVRRFKRYGENAGLAFWLYLWKSRHLGDEVR